MLFSVKPRRHRPCEAAIAIDQSALATGPMREVCQDPTSPPTIYSSREREDKRCTRCVVALLQAWCSPLSLWQQDSRGSDCCLEDIITHHVEQELISDRPFMQRHTRKIICPWRPRRAYAARGALVCWGWGYSTRLARALMPNDQCVFYAGFLPPKNASSRFERTRFDENEKRNDESFHKSTQHPIPSRSVSKSNQEQETSNIMKILAGALLLIVIWCRVGHQ